MASQINTIAMSGRLTADPETRKVGEGDNARDVTKLRIANNRSVKQGDEWTEVPGYFTVITWEWLARSAAEKLTKGDLVTVQGRLQWREYEVEGVKREATEIIAERLEGEGMFRPKADAAGTSSESSSSTPPPPDDDIPF